MKRVLLAIFLLSKTLIYSQVFPVILPSSQIAGASKDKIAYITSIFINEVNKADKFSRFPVFPNGILSDSVGVKLSQIWEKRNFEIIKCDNCLLNKTFGGFTLEGIKIIINDTTLSDITLQFSDNFKISDLSIPYKAPISQMILPKSFPEIISETQINKPQKKRRLSIGILAGGGCLTNTKSYGYSIGTQADYKLYNKVNVGVGANFNNYQIKYSYPDISGSRSKIFFETSLSSGCNILKNICINTGYKRTFGDFSDNGIYIEFEYIVNRISFKGSLSYFLTYNYTFAVFYARIRIY